jgi:hypothetical protein
VERNVNVLAHHLQLAMARDLAVNVTLHDGSVVTGHVTRMLAHPDVKVDPKRPTENGSLVVDVAGRLVGIDTVARVARA